MSERFKPTQPEEEQPKQVYFRVNDWLEAHAVIHEIAAGGQIAFGAGNRYPEDYTLFYKDALSGQGEGYFMMRVENGKHVELVADISIGKPPEGGEEK